MPVFENIENQQVASPVEERGRSRKSRYKRNDAFIPMTPSAPHDGEIIEYSPNRTGNRPPDHAAISRREQRMHRSKKYTQKINTGLINPFSDLMLSLADDGLKSFFLEGVKNILKTLRGLWPTKKKKSTPKSGDFQGRKRRPRNRGDYQKRRKQNGNEGKEKRNQERPNRNRRRGSKGRLPQQGKSENQGNSRQGNSRDGSANRRGNNANPNSQANPNANSNSNSNSKPNRNRHRRRRPSSDPKGAQSPRKD